jgi:hypothetical protein
MKHFIIVRAILHLQELNMKNFPLPLIVSAMIVLSSCGKSNSGADTAAIPANATMLFDQSKSVDLKKDQGVTVKRLRAWKLGPAAGQTDVAAGYGFEVWYQLETEKTVRYLSVGLNEGDARVLSDKDGNLYTEAAPPGFQFDHPERANSKNDVDDKKLTLSVTAKDAFVKEFPFFDHLNQSIEQKTSAGVTKSSSSKTWLADGKSDIMGGASGQYAASKSLAGGAPMGTWISYEDNSSFNIKKKMGCLQSTFSKDAASGDTTDGTVSVVWGDVELGGRFFLSGDQTVGATGPEDASADVLKLQVKWQNNLILTGVNINSKTLRIARTRSAPFYMNRLLPSDKSNTDLNLSGAEKLMRTCHNSLNNVQMPAGGVVDNSYLSAAAQGDAQLFAESDTGTLQYANRSIRFSPCAKAVMEGGYAAKAAVESLPAVPAFSADPKKLQISDSDWGLSSSGLAQLKSSSSSGSSYNTVDCPNSNNQLPLDASGFYWTGTEFSSAFSSASAGGELSYKEVKGPVDAKF